MINYQSKIKEIKINPKEWESYKAKTIMELASKNIKADVSEIEQSTLNKIAKDEVDKMLLQLRNENLDVIIMPPIIGVEGPNAAGFQITITLTYYLNEEIQKIKYNDLKIEFEYKKVPNDYFEKSFERIIDNYPILRKINGPVVANDVVTWNAIRSKDNKIVGTDDEIVITANDTPNFSINKAVIGRFVGEKFQTIAPDGMNFIITITNIERPVRTRLTDQNIHEIHLPNVFSLADFRAKIEYDSVKNNSSSELLRYYEKAIDAIVEKNHIAINNVNIHNGVNNHIINILENIDDESKKKALMEKINNKTGEAASIIELATKNAIMSYKLLLIDKIISKQAGIKISDDELAQEYNFLATSMFPIPKDITREEIVSILVHQKIALYLMKLNNNDQYNLVSQDLGMKI
ncbi:trigger factor-related chaperone [Mycoplasmopsis primatum]|uniref:trigger factor-related chaperone n=1 Tax=Mycoplasmopsis primatum TaxID=55604 RepID=UPI000495DD6A|nr:hypothetical protein [Mycoplasmopsis primatum]